MTETRNETLEEAMAHLNGVLSNEAAVRADRVAKMNSVYIETGRDAVFTECLDELIENAAASRTGVSGKRRALFVIGKSGSGKTTTIHHHLASRPEFQARTGINGETIHPLISFDAPKPLTLKHLAFTGLKAIGYPLYSTNMKEYEAWDLFKDQLRHRKVLFLHIDEMQHALRGNKSATIMDIADVIKSLLQIDGWPLHAIFSGVPALAAFLDAEKQLKERSIVMRFDTLIYPDNADFVRDILTNILEVDAQLSMGTIDNAEFIERLILATEGEFGSMINLIRYAAQTAHRRSKKTVSKEDFIAAYARSTGCLPSQNVFDCRDWRDIKPANSLRDIAINDRHGSSSKGRRP